MYALEYPQSSSGRQADAILASTTWLRVEALAPQLIARGILSGCAVTPIERAEVASALEILALGGGWLTPVTSLDGRPVGDGTPGAAFRALDEDVRADLRNPALTDAIPYDS